MKDSGKLDLPEAFVFETGTNQWRTFSAWPPPNATSRTLYLHDEGKLAFDVPPPSPGGFDAYVSDPAKPVPSTPGLAPGMAQRYMVDDQRFAARRTDVLAYQTAVLEEDLTLAGPIVPSLHVSTTGTDSDWIVKLIDVYPDLFPDREGEVNNTLGAYQQLVRAEVMRGKFRNSLDRPEPFVPGQAAHVRFTILDTFHTFRRGHRLMVQIQSSWFPLVNVNPQKFLNIYEASEADYQKAEQHIHRAPTRPSAIEVRVLPSTERKSGTASREVFLWARRSGESSFCAK